jgi:quinol-cytochrome oxidoreductase complex cytochrome b subunit
LPNFFISSFSKRGGAAFSCFKRFTFWAFVVRFILLTWLGIIPAEAPFTSVSLALTVVYFILFFV